jgi:hypothetical protein
VAKENKTILISHTANKSWRQNRRVTPRATSVAIGGASVKQEESSWLAMRRS